MKEPSANPAPLHWQPAGIGFEAQADPATAYTVWPDQSDNGLFIGSRRELPAKSFVSKIVWQIGPLPLAACKQACEDHAATMSAMRL